MSELKERSVNRRRRKVHLDKQCLGWANELRQLNRLLIMHFLMDCLYHLKDVSFSVQKRYGLLPDQDDTFTVLIDKFDRLRTQNGPYLNGFIQELVCVPECDIDNILDSTSVSWKGIELDISQPRSGAYAYTYIRPELIIQMKHQIRHRHITYIYIESLSTSFCNLLSYTNMSALIITSKFFRSLAQNGR